MAPVLGLEPEQLRVVCPWVGGGFGPKAAVYVEYLVAAAAARALGRPVKWTETRSEDMVSLVHGRDFVMTAKLGTEARRHDRRARRQGRRLRRRLPGDRRHPADAHPDDVAGRVRRSPRSTSRRITAITNTTTTGAYRGAGRPEATQLIERVMDVAADELGIDPAEIRRTQLPASRRPSR